MRACQTTTRLLSVLALVLGAAPARGVDRFWVGPDGGIFGDPKNWMPGGVPAGPDNAFFDVDWGTPPFEIDFFASHAHNRLIVRRGWLQFELNGNTYTLTSGVGSSVIVGETAAVGPCRVDLFMGTLSGVNGAIGTAANSTGTVQLWSATWLNSGQLTVGSGGSGELALDGPVNPATVSSASGVLGQFAGSTGQVSLQGARALWTNTGSLTVGSSGTGWLTVATGADVTAASGTVASGASGQGTVTVIGPGSTLGLGATLVVAGSGVADILVMDGGSVSNASATIGSAAGAEGDVLVTDAGSSWQCTGSLLVGHLGEGTLMVSEGGLVTTAIVSDIGFGAGATGQVTVTGPGSMWESAAMIRVGLNGLGALTVADGGTVAADPNVTVYQGDTVSGDGTIDAILNNFQGAVRPGLSAGQLTVQGSYIQQAGAALEIELGGTAPGAHDVLAVTGSAALAGALDLSLIGGFVAEAGDRFTILTAGSVSGSFEEVKAPVLSLPGRAWEVQYGPASVTVVVAQESVDLLVSGGDSDDLIRYDGATGDFLGQFVPTGSGGLGSPEATAVGPDGNLYASSLATSSVLRYHGQTGAFIDAFVPTGGGGLSSPVGLAFGPDGNLYVASHATGTIHRYDGSTGAFIDVFATASGIDHLHHLIFGPDENLYVSVYDQAISESSVWRYDGTTGGFIDVFATGGGLENPAGLAFGPDGHLYVAGGFSGNVVRFDGETGAAIDVFVPAGSGGLSVPWGLAFGPDGNLYVSSSATSSVLRYDGTSGAFIDEFVTPNSGGLLNAGFLLFFPAPCPADTSGDGAVGTPDLLALLAAWGTDPGGPPDLDGDGTVGTLDLLAMLAQWGACP